jgi:hypothetical protein
MHLAGVFYCPLWPFGNTNRELNRYGDGLTCVAWVTGGLKTKRHSA